MISNSGADENGRYSGGVAGDQNQKEWRIIEWYDRKPWNCVLRYPDATVRETIAALAEKAANNDMIGYDQGERTTYWGLLSSPSVAFDPSRITVPCEADCSAGVIANVKAAGYIHNIPALRNITATYTGNMRTSFSNAGFTVLTESKYLTSDKYLLRGDILLNDLHHTATNLTDGEYTKTTNVSTLNIIDIASWQQGMVVADMVRKNPDLNGFMIKATGGSHYRNPYFTAWAGQCMSVNIPFGLYHFLNDGNKGNSSPEREAEFFLNAVSPYLGKAVLALDWESYGLNWGADGAKQFLDYVYSHTGVKPIFYTYSSALKQHNCSKIAESGYKLWIANYGSNAERVGFDPFASIGNQTYFGMPIMYQYGSKGKLNGWNGYLDLNVFYGKVGNWTDLAKRHTTVDVTTVAREVLKGIWGNGDVRKQKLSAAGYDYNAVQAEVNRLIAIGTGTKSVNELALEVLNGLWSNGEDRKNRLINSGYDYEAVQNQVNYLVKDWARRFAIGEAGNGVTNRTNWIIRQGITPVQAPAIYQLVQNYLNKNIGRL